MVGCIRLENLPEAPCWVDSPGGSGYMGEVAHFFRSQGHAEDLILWHRFNYYVVGVPLITDAAYDELEHSVRLRWGIGVASHCVGSAEAKDYPRYIQEARRPGEEERRVRDAAIVARWLENL